MRTTIAEVVSRKTVLVALIAGLVLGAQAAWSSSEDIGSLVSDTMGGISGAGQNAGDIRAQTDPILAPSAVGRLSAVAPSIVTPFDANSGLIRQFY